MLNSFIISNCRAFFSDKRYLFRFSKSTADVLTERVYYALDKKAEARAVALKVSKAFDRISHSGILHKLTLLTDPVFPRES